MITVENLYFEYPTKRVLEDICFTLEKGSITALVGPNGVGKTTLMRCMVGLEPPFSGRVEIDGIDVAENPREAHKKIGYLSDFFGLYDDLSVWQCLELAARIHHLQGNMKDIVEKSAEKLSLTSYLNVNTGTLSRGWRQRVAIAQTIIHNPEVVLLDEPASGLDPEARVELARLFLNLQKQGITLLVSSHILAELEDYCTDMLLLRDRKIVHCRAKGEHLSKNPRTFVTIHLSEVADHFKNIIQTIPSIIDAEYKGKEIDCTVTADEKELNGLLKQLLEKNVPVYSFSVRSKKLQDIYMDHAQSITSPTGSR